MVLPLCENLLLDQTDSVLTITLNRPEARNAMSLKLVKEITDLFIAIKDSPDIRVVVLKGADGNFCSGGDIKDMTKANSNASSDDQYPYYNLSRAFGLMLTQVNIAPQVVITLLEGAVLGGGFGLTCVSDIAIAHINSQFGLPETNLGLPPAQIAPFVVSRIGLTQTRRLALTGARFNGSEALKFGLVHFITETSEEMAILLNEQLNLIKRCAPKANAVTKNIILNVGLIKQEALLDHAARAFSDALQGDEGIEGTTAFARKRKPEWAE